VSEKNIQYSTFGNEQKNRRGVLRVLHVLHSMNRAGAEQLVYELATANRGRMETAVICLDTEGPLAEDLRRQGVRVYFTQRKPGIDFAQVGRIAKVIREFSPDVIHAHQYTPFFYAALGRRSAGVGRIIFTEHGRHYPDVVGWKRRAFNRCWLGRRAGAITAVCEFAKKRLIENDAMRADRIEVVYNGVDVERFSGDGERGRIRSELGISNDAIVVVQVGTFRAVKDQATAVRAFAIAHKSFPSARFLFVGDGPDLPACRELAKKSGVGDAIGFLGQRSDVATILSAADLMLMTSLSEAHSVSLLEGMASKLAVVATRVGGIPETVDEGRTGLLAEAGDVESVAGAMMELLGDAGRRSLMGQAGYERVVQRFSRKKMHERYWSIYSRLAGREAKDA
jgi:N-acetyl-alpha-D-glucosaminyl L-malate synthase BshA